MALFRIAVWLTLGGIAATAATKAKPVPDYWEEFTGAKVARIQIEIPAEGMEQLRLYHWVRENPPPKPEVRAVIREGGVTYSNVAVRPKGSLGSSRPIDSQPALSLSFDKFVSGQKFHGLGKISLNNSVFKHPAE